MALVLCPECKNKVSDQAQSCPTCGYNVKQYFVELRKYEENQHVYEEQHKPVVFSDKEWELILITYEQYLEKCKNFTSKIAKEYRKIYFDPYFKTPVGFSNMILSDWRDFYNNLIILIKDNFNKLDNAYIKCNIEKLDKINVFEIARVTWLRWHDMIMDPIEQNSRTINFNADSIYRKEYLEKSQMPYGIITNSIASMVWYSALSVTKEVKAEESAERSRDTYINSSYNNIQQNVSRFWEKHFESDFLPDVEMAHKILLFNTGEVLFEGIDFDWFVVDKEYNTPARQNWIESIRKKRAEEKEKQKRDALMMRQVKLCEFEEKRDSLYKENDKAMSEYKEIGFVIFGEKAKRKKQIEIKISQVQKEIECLEKKIRDVKNTRQVVDEMIYFNTYEHMGEGKVYDYIIEYDENSNCYEVRTKAKGHYAVLPEDFTEKYGSYRTFIGEEVESTIYFKNNEMDYAFNSVKINEMF